MDAPSRILCLVAFIAIIICAASAHDEPPKQDHVEDEKLELYDGVYVSIPKDNSTGRMLSLEVDDRSVSEGRGKKKKLMAKILPMFILPFVLQSAIIPLALGMLKFMLVKSLLVGKLALALIMVNAFKNHNSFKGRDAEMASAHYGYHDNGIEHYASYMN